MEGFMAQTPCQNYPAQRIDSILEVWFAAHRSARTPFIRGHLNALPAWAFLLPPYFPVHGFTKELVMTISKPNRTHVQSSDPMQMKRHKESGDQHILPIDEPESPHRPHRLSRQDMQKTLPPERESTTPEEPESP